MAYATKGQECNFFVKHSLADLKNRYKNLEKRFAVEIHLKEHEDGFWVTLTGEPSAILPAKSYIENLCSSHLPRKFPYPGHLRNKLCTDDFRCQLENSSNAIVSFDAGVDIVTIKGNDDDVAIAISIFDDRVQTLLKQVDLMDEKSSTQNDIMTKIEQWSKTPAVESKKDCPYEIVDIADSDSDNESYTSMTEESKKQFYTILTSSDDEMESEIYYLDQGKKKIPERNGPIYHRNESSSEMKLINGKSSACDTLSIDTQAATACVEKKSQLTDDQCAEFWSRASQLGCPDENIEKAISICNRESTYEQFEDILNKLSGLPCTLDMRNVAMQSILKGARNKPEPPVTNHNPVNTNQSVTTHSSIPYAQSVPQIPNLIHMHAPHSSSFPNMSDVTRKPVNTVSPFQSVNGLANEYDTLPAPTACPRPELPPLAPNSTMRMLVLDGSNIAYAHGKQKFNNQKMFSAEGIYRAVDYFRKHYNYDHNVLKAIVPINKKNSRDDPNGYLTKLEDAGYLAFSPAKTMKDGRKVVPYDDRFILDLAAETNGVVISNDKYEDLIHERPEYQDIIHNRVVQFMFANDIFMPTKDPNGRHAPTLTELLQIERCRKETPKTYEPQQSLPSASRIEITPLLFTNYPSSGLIKQNPRGESETQEFYNILLEMFPAEQLKIREKLRRSPFETDINVFIDELARA